MLVAHGGVRGGVAEAGHEFGERRAGLRSQDGSGVAEVVEVEVGASGRLASLIETLAEGARVQVPTGDRRKQQSLGAGVHVIGQVRLDRTDEMGGTWTVRRPASVLGVPTVASPLGQVTPRATLMRPMRRSTSLRRNSAISPYLIAHQAPSSTASRRRSGMCSTITASSSRDAILTSCARSTWPAPSIWQGFLASNPTRGSAAVAQMARRSWYACALGGRPGVELEIPAIDVRGLDVPHGYASERRQEVPIEQPLVVGARSGLDGPAAGAPGLQPLGRELAERRASCGARDGPVVGGRPGVQVDQLLFGGQPGDRGVLGVEGRRSAV